MENTVDKSILFDNFSGRSTPLQKNMIEEWLQVPGNIEYYYEWLDEWEKANPQFFPDEELAFERIIQHGETGVQLVAAVKKLPLPVRVFRSRLAAVAAVFLLLLAGGLVIKDHFLYRTMSTAYGETRSVILPDGSLVSMNANSTIRYSRLGFGKANREVFLAGEADFTVTHNSGNHPFLVTTDHDLDVLVLGTRFTVYAREKQARVVLRQGKVQLNFREERVEKKVILQPGDLFTAPVNGSNKIEHISNPENLSAWKDHEFLFDGTSLSEIAGMIRDNFGLSMQFEQPGLADHRISGSFHADTAAELLDVIAQLLNIQYKIREGTVYFFE